MAENGSSRSKRDNGTHAGQKRSAALEGVERRTGAQPGEQGKRRRYEGRDAAGQSLRGLMSCCGTPTCFSKRLQTSCAFLPTHLAECQKRESGPLSFAAGAPQPLEPHLLTLSMLPQAQWQNLVHLDAIKVRAGCLCTDVDSGGLTVCWLGVMLHAVWEDCVALRMRLLLPVWCG